MSFPTVVLLAPAAACLLSWLGLGAAVPRRLLTGDALLDLLTRIGAGAAVLGLAFYGLGRAGAFERWLLASITLVLAACGAWVALRSLRGARLPRLGAVGMAAAGLVAAAAVLNLVAATAPPTQPDALIYHLALPRQWLETGQIEDVFWRFESFNPLAIEMLFAQGLALGGGGTAGAVGAVVACLAAAAVFGLARELGAGDDLAGVIGAVLFVLQGMFTWLATSSFVEPGVAFFSTLAVWHALRYTREGASSSLLGAGLLAGAAAGTKYLGGIAAAIVLVPLAVLALRRGRAAPLAVAGALAAAVALPWYVKNLLVADNPIYPVLFGGKYLASSPSVEEASTSAGIQEGLAAGGGVGALARLPILPLDLLLDPVYAKGRYVSTVIFVAAPLALLTQAARVALALLGGVVAFVAVYLVVIPSQTRFLLPALAVLAAMGGCGCARLVRAGRWPGRTVAALLAAAAVLWAAPSYALTRQLLPPAVGAEDRGEFLQRVTGVEELMTEIERRVDGTVAFAEYKLIFNYDERAVQLGAPEFAVGMERETLLARLRDHDARYVVSPEINLRRPFELPGLSPGWYPEGRVRRLSTLAPILEPIARCLRHVALIDARIVLSRARGTSYAQRFGLLDLRPCYGDSTDSRSRASRSSTASPSSRYASSVFTDQTS